MPGQKRKRGTSFLKVGPANENTSHVMNTGFDAMNSAYNQTGAGFSCETPIMGPLAPSAHQFRQIGPNLGGNVAQNKIFRFSPRLNASSGIFNSPMFTVRTPVFEYSTAPSVFQNQLMPAHPQSGFPQQQQLPTGMMSPMPFMDSPGPQLYSREHQNSFSMDSVPGLSLSGPQGQNSVIERFKKFFDNQRISDEYSANMNEMVNFNQAVRQQHQQMPTVNQTTGIMPLIAEDDDDVSSADVSGESQDLSPSAQAEFNDSLLRAGSSCHQCKSRRMQGHLSFCSGAKTKRKSCRKKYCDSCLSKFYQMQPCRRNPPREQATWCCPSCRGICCCAACRRSKVQHHEQQLQRIHYKTPEVYSPATSMAVGMVYFGDFDLLNGGEPPHVMPQRQPPMQRMPFPHQ
uniref:Zinc-finger domain-containing protein n=1 Tax=Spongospora subterranea TaxID=70186 RepID=A0A0H5R696_9EUKA|eukprot:CRZ09675.1 hypothetical protein [Spongospora subterranea]